MVKSLSLILLVLCAACGRPAEAPVAPEPVQLEQAWRLGGFAHPESVALSADGSSLYVTNVNGEGEAEDGNGFISLVSSDGRMLNRDWARGLDAPKGIALVGDLLYVADINDIVVIAAADGSLLRRIAAPGARFLNDLAVTPDGLVLAADSDTRRIYALRDGAAEIWLKHDLLESANGLLPEPERVIVTTMAGRLLAIDIETRAISVLAEGLGDADGVALLGDGRYLVSEWPGVMHVVGADGAFTTILDTREEGRLLNDFLLVGDTLYQPHWDPSELTAYRVRR
jgi:glucose/arabinose dehydrogenase